MNYKKLILIVLFVVPAVLLFAQEGPRITNNQTEGILSFYDADGNLIKKINYYSHQSAMGELIDSGKYQMEFDDSDLRYQSATVINNEIAVLQDHIESYMLPLVVSTQVYDRRGEVIYSYGGNLNISYSKAGHCLVMENVIVDKKAEGGGPDIDIYYDDPVLVYFLSSKTMKQVRLNPEDQLNRDRGRLNAGGDLYLTLDKSRIIILDPVKLSVFYFPYIKGSSPDFDLAYNFSFIKDFFIRDNILYISVYQFKDSGSGNKPFKYLVELTYGL